VIESKNLAQVHKKGGFLLFDLTEFLVYTEFCKQFGISLPTDFWSKPTIKLQVADHGEFVIICIEGGGWFAAPSQNIKNSAGEGVTSKCTMEDIRKYIAYIG